MGPDPSSRLAGVTPAGVAVVVGILGAGLALAWLALPGHLLGVSSYDAGVYLGVSLRLVSGVVPYRDFLFIEPPGIALLMSPFGFLAHVAGEPVALAASRVLTAVVSGLNVGLVAWLVRPRGRVAMAIAGGALALFPLAPAATDTLKLEPYLVLFLLLGALVAFGREVPSGWRLVAAGALFGMAGAVKVWALFPFLALVGCELARSGRRSGWLVAGAAAGFGLPCLPFLVLAPSRFVHDVVLDQAGRGSHGYTAVSLGSRLVELSGLSGVPGLANAADLAVVVAAVLFVALGALVLVAIRTAGSSWTLRDSYVAAAAGASVLELLVAPGLYNYYAYFTAPFLAALAGTALAVVGPRLSGRLSARGASRWSSGRRRRVVRAATAAAGVGVLAALVVGSMAYANSLVPQSGVGPSGSLFDPGPAIASVVRPGACVLSDDPVFLIEANRFEPARPGCPPLVDPYGMWLVDGHGHGVVGRPPYPPALVATWRADLAAANDVVVVDQSPWSDIPWAPTLRRWFVGHFSVALIEQDAVVYARRTVAGP